MKKVKMAPSIKIRGTIFIFASMRFNQKPFHEKYNITQFGNLGSVSFERYDNSAFHVVLDFCENNLEPADSIYTAKLCSLGRTPY